VAAPLCFWPLQSYLCAKAKNPIAAVYGSPAGRIGLRFCHPFCPDTQTLPENKKAARTWLQAVAAKRLPTVRTSFCATLAPLAVGSHFVPFATGANRSILPLFAPFAPTLAQGCFSFFTDPQGVKKEEEQVKTRGTG